MSQKTVTTVLPGPELARHLQRRMAVGAGGNPDQDAFVARQTPRARRRILVGDGDDLVVHVLVEDVRHETGADALDLVVARLAARQHRRRRRLDRDDRDAGHRLAQHLADPGDGSPGAHPGDESVDAVELLATTRARSSRDGPPDWRGC